MVSNTEPPGVLAAYDTSVRRAPVKAQRDSMLVYILGEHRPIGRIDGATREITYFQDMSDRKFKMIQSELITAILSSCGGQELVGMRGFDRFIMRIATQLEFGWTSTSPVDLYFRLLYTKHMELTAGDSGTRAPFCGYAIHGLESLL